MTTKDLTPSEISNLWNTYLVNTMTVWVTRYFLANSQDEEIVNMLKNAEMFSVKEVKNRKIFLKSSAILFQMDLMNKMWMLKVNLFILITSFFIQSLFWHKRDVNFILFF